jgi:hypothetical protein
VIGGAVRWAVEFVAAVLVVGLVWIWFGTAFAYGDGGGEVPTWFTVACAGTVAAIGFGVAAMSHHFPWLTLLAGSVGAVAYFSSLDLFQGGLELAGCAALALGCGATPAILWKRSRRSSSTED